MGRGSICLQLAALLLLSACGGGTAAPELRPGTATIDEQGFVLQLLPGSELDGGQSGRLSLEVTEASGWTEISVMTSRAAGLKSFSFELAYDPERFALLEARASGNLSADSAGQLLELSHQHSAGRVTCGQVLANWDRRAGFSGSGCLAVLRFLRQAEPPLAALRSISTPPLSTVSSAPCFINSGSGANNMIMLYANSGDYNQDGIVGIADLTPLGLHFGVSGEFSPFDVRSIVDGDGNGEINLADITPIGAGFGNSVLGGFNIYRSSSAADYPAEPDSASTIAHFLNLPLSGLMGNPGEDRLGQSINLEPASPAAEYFWVRPLDSEGTEGVPGTLCLVPTPGSLSLSVLDPVTGGSGSEEDPYFVEPGSAYDVSLVHGVDGDVTLSEFTRISVTHTGLVIDESPLPAEYDEETASIVVDSDGEGRFSVFASYGSQQADGLHFRVTDPDNNPPAAFFTTDAAEGIAPFSVSCNATGSADGDGTVVRYEWDGDGDGFYETTEFFGSLTVDITDGGAHEIFLRVVDDDGAVSDPVSRIVQSAGWLKTEAGDVGGAAAPASPVLRMADGKPIIAYRSGPNLNVAYSNDSLGDDWGGISLSNAHTPEQISMELIGGRPAIAWRRSASPADGIYYSISANPQGTGFSSPVMVHGGSGNHSPSLAEIDGRPALAYAWDTGSGGAFPHELFYVRSLDAEGNDGGDWDLIGEGRSLFSAAELWLDRNSLQKVDTQVPSVDGRPGILFISNNDELGDNWQLRFIKATNNAATSWSFPGPLQSGGAGYIQHMSVTSIVSRPRFVYQNLDDSLSYRTCSDLAAEDWGSLFGVSDAGPAFGRGYFSSLANIGGFPALLHYDDDEQELRYVESGNATGEGGFGSMATVSVVGRVGEYDTALTRANYFSLYAMLGQPAMAWHDTDSNKLVFARYYEIP